MGQGLHTKIAQIAATSFNIPLSAVFISETSTDKVRHISTRVAFCSFFEARISIYLVSNS